MDVALPLFTRSYTFNISPACFLFQFCVADAYCHPYFRRKNRDLCVYVPREKKRQPKNKKSRRNRNGMRSTPTSGDVPSHRRALSSDEVAQMLNSPSVSPIPEDYMVANARGSHPLHRSAYGPGPGVVQQNYTTQPVTSANVVPQQQQGSSFFAEADPSPYQLQQAQQQAQPAVQRPTVQQQQQPQMQSQQQLPPGRPLQFPIKSKRTQSKAWMQDHDKSLWNYVNGLVVDSTKSFDNKNELKREASNFSTDEILAEIASTFNGSEKQTRSPSVGSGSSNSANSQATVSSQAPAYPSPTRDAAYYGL